MAIWPEFTNAMLSWSAALRALSHVLGPVATVFDHHSRLGPSSCNLHGAIRTHLYLKAACECSAAPSSDTRLVCPVRTMTGRLATSNPNMQSVPAHDERGRLFRAAFTADEGHVLVAADYSQVRTNTPAAGGCSAGHHHLQGAVLSAGGV